MGGLPGAGWSVCGAATHGCHLQTGARKGGDMSRAPTPIRQTVIFMGIALGLALAVALIFPETSELAPLVSIPIPLIATRS